MKKVIYIFPAVMISIFIFASAYSQEDMTVVDNSVFENPQRVPCLFKHDEHNEAASIENCNECHHVFEDGKKLEDDSSEDRSCSDCHTIEANGDKLPLMKAFHENCKGCHVKLSKGPVMCGECHKQ